MKFLSTLITSFLLLLHLSSSSQTIVDIVVGSPDHNTLETAVVAANLAGTLSGAGPFTLFAPTDAAFAAIDPTVLNTLLADPSGDLTKILTHHVLNGVAGKDNIFDGMKVSTLFKQNIEFDINGNTITIGGANVSVVNIEASNGVVHVIDAVLIPEITPASIVDIVVNSPNHTTLETAVLAAGLQGTLSGPGFFTLFAPTDAAFAAVDPATLNALLADPQGALTEVLTYHAVNGVAFADSLFDGQKMANLQGQNLNFTINGNGAFVNDVAISVTDIKAANGVVHVIDAVLLPGFGATTMPESVLDVVVASPDHTTLETAVLAAGLNGALSGAGPFTLFAPTDAAFAAVDPATLNALLADPQGALTDVLLNHVINGVASTNNIFDGMTLSSLQGSPLKISLNGNGAFINNATITVTDIRTKNGVVHVIDAVLVP